MKSSTSGLPRGNEKQAKTLRTVLWVLLAIAAVVFIVTGLTEGYAFGSLGPVLVVGALFGFFDDFEVGLVDAVDVAQRV